MAMTDTATGSSGEDGLFHRFSSILNRPAKQDRNLWIDIWRLVASVLIMLFHFRPEAPVTVYSSGLFVEFFFMLTGYFALTHAAQPDCFARNGIRQYVLRFYLRVLPYAAAGVLLLYVSHMLNLATSGNMAAKQLVFLPFEVPLLQCSGLYLSIAYVLWYLSIILFCLPIVLKLRQMSSGSWWFFATIVPILLYGYLIHTYGTVRVNTLYNVWPRAAAGLLAGGGVLEASKWLAGRKCSRAVT